jgi:hypothetical protein
MPLCGEDGVGEPSAHQSNGLGAGLAAGEELVDVVAAGTDPAGLGHGDHVQGAVGGAVPRLSRTLPAELPDQAGIGAVPVNRA